MCGERTRLHMITFSNYRACLQGAILAVRALKQAMSNGNHNLDGKNDNRLTEKNQAKTHMQK